MNLCKSTKYSVFISKWILFSKLCKCIHLNTLINWMATNNWSLCNLWWHCPLLSGPMCRNSKQAQFFVSENDLVTHYDHFYSNYCVIYILAQQVLHSTATSYLTTQSTFHQKDKISHALHLNTEPILCSTYWHLNLIMIHAMHLDSTPQWASIPRAEPQITAVILPQHNRRQNLHQSY